MEILDCTLRDGGYYTNWDFSDEVVQAYIQAMNELPINYLEIGYRNNPSSEYLGRFGYCPLSTLRRIHSSSTKKIAVMLNEKSTRIKDLDALIMPIKGYVDMIRLAVDPKNFSRAVDLAIAVKTYGFEVGFNMMYLSKWHDYVGLMTSLNRLEGVVDILNMVDSFGGVGPQDVREILLKIRENTCVPVGFHGHDNLHLSLANTLTAMECGVDCVDATILGMGRGAGNLKMELLLTYLSKGSLSINFNELGNAVEVFKPLLDKYNWGTNLPYMISGTYSISQRDVMTWVTNRTYSFGSVVRGLTNRSNGEVDNAKYPQFSGRRADRVILVGGGCSVVEHQDALIEYLNANTDVVLIFVTARYAHLFVEVANDKFYCIVGSEARRMESVLHATDYKGSCILAPYPRQLGTEVPKYAEETTYELSAITFTSHYTDSCTAIGLQTAIELGAKDIALIGYDGYSGGILSEKEADLTRENRFLFEAFQANIQSHVFSFTPTLYESLKTESIYKYL